MSITNGDAIKKTLETSSLAPDGTLKPKQQSSFIKMVKKYNAMMGAMRFHTMTQKQEEIARLHLSDPISFPVLENDGTTRPATMSSTSLTLTTTKLESFISIPTEVFQENLEGVGYEDVAMRMVSERIATDMSLLAVRGDTSLKGLGTDPHTVLYSTLNGLRTLAGSGCHVVSAGGASAQPGIFNLAKRILPKQYHDRGRLRWMMSPTLQDDLAYNQIAGDIGTGTSLNKQGLEGRVGYKPAGIPILPIDAFPDNVSVTTGAASRAIITGEKEQPYIFVASGVGQNNLFLINVDGGGVRTVTFPAGRLLLPTVLDLIRGALINDDVTVLPTPEGGIQIISNTPGATSSLAVTTGGTPFEAAEVLFGDAINQKYGGVIPFTETGDATGITAAEDNGTYCVLTDPKNLIWGVQTGTRVYVSFNAQYDRIEITIYNQVAFQIENPDACVLVTDISLASLL